MNPWAWAALAILGILLVVLCVLRWPPGGDK
jgi:hypothetical protein